MLVLFDVIGSNEWLTSKASLKKPFFKRFVEQHSFQSIFSSALWKPLNLLVNKRKDLRTISLYSFFSFVPVPQFMLWMESFKANVIMLGVAGPPHRHRRYQANVRWSMTPTNELKNSDSDTLACCNICSTTN